MPTLLLLTAQESVRESLSRSVSGLSCEVIVARSDHDALQASLSVRFDALVLDTAAASPGHKTETVFPATGRLPVVFLATAGDRWTPGLLPLDRRLDQVLVKPFSVPELRAAVQRVIARSPGIHGRSWTIGQLEIDSQTHEARGEMRSVLLTPTEFRLLEYFAARPATVLTPGELLKEVWGFPAGTGSPEVLRAHMKNLRAKLRACGDDPIETLPRRGYRVRPGSRL
jgi:two-component system OmpR family response regulator